MGGLRRSTVVVLAVISAVGLPLFESFIFVSQPTRSVVGRAFVNSNNGRRLASHHDHDRKASTSLAPRQRAASGGALVMLAKKGKGGSGMTNIGRVVATRERMAKFKEPQKVMVSNLDFNLNEQDIWRFCTQVGTVARVKLIRKRNAKTSKGYAFVDYELPLWATAAIEELNGVVIRGRRVEVKSAFSDQERKQQETRKQWLEEQGKLEEERREADDKRVQGISTQLEMNDDVEGTSSEADTLKSDSLETTTVAAATAGTTTTSATTTSVESEKLGDIDSVANEADEKVGEVVPVEEGAAV